MQLWKPASEFEEHLMAAQIAEDAATCLGLLRETEFALPITAAAAAGREPVRWITVAREDRVWLLAYTSAESMESGTDGEATHCRITTLVELAAGWPDAEWGLAINPGLPIQLLLESGTVARLAAPTLAEQRAAFPEAPTPIVEKLLTLDDLEARFANRDGRISGYVHLHADIAHIGSPNVLLDALGRAADEAQLLADSGSAFVVRWPAIGPDLYRTPYGGTTERACAAMQGWIIEEPPFIGTGFVPNVDQVIREFKVDGIQLPHGAEILEVTMQGAEIRRAVWDGDAGTWMLAIQVPTESTEGTQ